MEFKDLVKSKRLELNLTMEELANKVGVSKATIQRWESGEIKNVRRDKILKLSNALSTTPAYLMGWSNDLVENVVEEDKDIVKHFLKYNSYHDDLNEEEVSMKSLLNTFGYDLSRYNNEYYLTDDYGAYSISEHELNNLKDDIKKYLQFNIDKILKEKRESTINKINKNGR